MTRKLLVGSNNANKRAEIAKIISDLDFEVVTPNELGIFEIPEETGKTFLENATIKAVFFAAASGLLTLADDSGLVVDALGGLPGVRSARFAGEDATDADNCKKLIDAMKDVPDGERTARFECTIVLADRSGVRASARGACEGSIGRAASGSSGFGYDPLFFYPPEGVTFAQLSPELKNSVSHRGAALRGIREALATISRL
jgi:XTP/dITP diphosphohydrolase